MGQRKSHPVRSLLYFSNSGFGASVPPGEARLQRELNASKACRRSCSLRKLRSYLPSRQPPPLPALKKRGEMQEPACRAPAVAVGV